MGSRHSVNEGVGKQLYRKDNSVKRFRPFSESADSKTGIFCAHPLPNLCSYLIGDQILLPPFIRKILASIKCFVRNSGPERAAPILWAPRISDLHVHEIPRFFGGGYLGLVGGGAGKCRFYFYGRGDFSDFNLN